MWIQREIVLKPRSRGFHLITREVLTSIPEITQLKIGLLQVFIKHTSAALTLNENADPTVRQDRISKALSIGWCRKMSLITVTVMKAATICPHISSPACWAAA